MVYGITFIFLGLLAAPSLLLSKRPVAEELLDKITPYQGWIGLIFCLWGLWGVVSTLLNMSTLVHYPILWVTWISSSFIQAVVGFILGYGMITKLLLSKNEQALEKGEQLRTKLLPIQGKLGLVGVGIGVWVIIASLMFYS